MIYDSSTVINKSGVNLNDLSALTAKTGNAFSFSNTGEGFQNAKLWALELAATNDKKQIVLGLEPTGHY